MGRIKVFALVEGRIVERLSARVSGTFIRIHYILKHLKEQEGVELSCIPFEYRQKFSDGYSRANHAVDLFYHFAVPLLSLLIILLRRPHFVYFSYPNAVYSNALNVPLLRLAKRMGVKLLMYEHDWAEQGEMRGRSPEEVAPLRELEAELVRMSDVLVVVSSKYPEYETALLPGGLEEEEFADLDYRTRDGRFNIAYVGLLAPDESIDLLVDAAAMLHEKHPCVRLLLFGKIASLDEETLHKIEQSPFITHRLIPRTELVSHFAEVDVFVYPADPSIPYHYNTRPTKFFEYIGSEIPFIATRCDGLKLVSDGKGFLWVEHSAQDFSDKLEYLLQHPEERLRLSRELCELKKDNTWAKRAQALRDILVSHLGSTAEVQYATD